MRVTKNQKSMDNKNYGIFSTETNYANNKFIKSEIVACNNIQNHIGVSIKDDKNNMDSMKPVDVVPGIITNHKSNNQTVLQQTLNVNMFKNDKEKVEIVPPSSLCIYNQNINENDILETECQVTKKPKIDSDCLSNEKPRIFENIHDLFNTEHERQRLIKMSQKELMDLIIIKFTETILMNSEIRELKKQLKDVNQKQIDRKNQFEQLTKHVEDFEYIIRCHQKNIKCKSSPFVAPGKIMQSVAIQTRTVRTTSNKVRKNKMDLAKSKINEKKK